MAAPAQASSNELSRLAYIGSLGGGVSRSGDFHGRDWWDFKPRPGIGGISSQPQGLVGF